MQGAYPDIATIIAKTTPLENATDHPVAGIMQDGLEKTHAAKEYSPR
jgi:hypothetical protein